jgi:hypothetical protein
MSSRLGFCLVSALLVGVAASLGFVLAQQSLAATTSIVSLTATMRESLFDADGAIKVNKLYVVATRGDGSTVRKRDWSKPGGGTIQQRRILDLTAMEEIVVDGLTDSVTTVPLRKQVVDYYRHTHSCAGAAASGSIPTESILGYAVVKVTEESGEAAVRVRTERWLAPALGCFALRTAFSHFQTDSGSYRLVNQREAIDVLLGEPDRSLFEKPSGYLERSPSARRTEYLRRYPEKSVTCPDCMKDNDKQADDVYYSRRASRGQ